MSSGKSKGWKPPTAFASGGDSKHKEVHRPPIPNNRPTTRSSAKKKFAPQLFVAGDTSGADTASTSSETSKKSSTSNTSNTRSSVPNISPRAKNAAAESPSNNNRSNRDRTSVPDMRGLPPTHSRPGMPRTATTKTALRSNIAKAYEAPISPRSPKDNNKLSRGVNWGNDLFVVSDNKNNSETTTPPKPEKAKKKKRRWGILKGLVRKDTIIVDRQLLQTRLEWNQLRGGKVFKPYKQQICDQDDDFPDPEELENAEDDELDEDLLRIRSDMLDDPELTEREIAAFFEGLKLYQVKVNSLKSQLEGLKSLQKTATRSRFQSIVVAAQMSRDMSIWSIGGNIERSGLSAGSSRSVFADGGDASQRSMLADSGGASRRSILSGFGGDSQRSHLDTTAEGDEDDSIKEEEKDGTTKDCNKVEEVTKEDDTKKEEEDDVKNNEQETNKHEKVEKQESQESATPTQDARETNDSEADPPKTGSITPPKRLPSSLPPVAPRSNDSTRKSISIAEPEPESTKSASSIEPPTRMQSTISSPNPTSAPSFKRLQSKAKNVSRKSLRALSIKRIRDSAGSENSDIQRLLRELEEAEARQKKLEKQLAQAGVVIAEDIPYAEAKAQVERIAIRMNEIGGSDVTHPDKEVEAQLQKEYFKLEQDMEKYTAALQLTDEWAEEQEEMERQWEESVEADNIEALKKLRRHMPVDVRNLSESALVTEPTPNGKFLPRAIAKKFKRTNVLQILRRDPEDIVKMHPSTLENMRVTGLTLTERRAIYAHLKDVGPRWKAMQAEKMTERKWTWYNMMKSNFKENVDAWQRHVDQYGPPGNHPYATRENPNEGCPLIGKQCPLKADKLIDYDGDYGYTEEAEYFASEVKKSDLDDPGAKAKQEALELAREKKATERSDGLKKHYKGKILQVSLANGSCEGMDESMDKMEDAQEKWIKEQLSSGSGDLTEEKKKKEITGFNEALNEFKLAILQFADRSGMQLTGKRDANADQPDIRSSIEIGLCEEVIELAESMFEGIRKRMEKIEAKDGRMRSTIDQLRNLMEELHERNVNGLTNLGVERPERSRKLKTVEIITAEVKKTLKEAAAKEDKGADDSAAAAAAPSGGPGRGGRGGLLDAIQGGRGRGGGGRGGLLDAIAGRGGRGGRGEGGGRGGLLDAIQGRGGRGRGGGGGGGRGGLMAAIAARGNAGA